MRLILIFLMLLTVGSVSATLGDIEIPLDQDFSWAVHVDGRGLIYGSEEWKVARAESMEWEARILQAQKLNSQGDHMEGADLHPLSWCKAWYRLNALRKAMGGIKGEDGTWSGYKVETQVQYELCLQIADLVKVHIQKARESKMEGKGDLHVDKVEAYLQSYLTGVLKEQ